MNVSIYVNSDEGSDLMPNDIKRLESLYTLTLKNKKCIPDDVRVVEISLVFVNEIKMTQINAKYRDTSEVTDVLSFPMWESKTGDFNPPSNWDVLPLGDIVVCTEVVKQNAINQKKEFINELVLVICHGLLHLIGLDHDTIERKQAMWKEQDQIVSKYFKF